MKMILAISLFFLMAFTNYNAENKDCSILHKGTFTYGNTGSKIKVVINGNDHMEYHNNGKFIIQSKLDWMSDCEYNMTMTKITIPDFPYGVGDVMNVRIDSVKGNEIYYTSTVKGQSWNSILTKIKD